jgi:Ras-related protein Rab-5C
MTDFRVVLLGDSAAGKTAILQRLVWGVFDEFYHPTLGVNPEVWNLEVEGRAAPYHVSLVDTAGQEAFRSLAQNYLRNASIVIFVFDVTSLGSFTALDTVWVTLLESVCPMPSLIVVANKCDLPGHAVDAQACNELVSRMKARCWFLTSAKTGTGLTDLRTGIGRCIGETVFPTEVAAPALTIEGPDDRRSQCC